MTDRPLAQEMRDYQEEALVAVDGALARGEKTVVAVATGGGKSSIAAEYLARNFHPETERALVLAHSQEIIYQLTSRIERQMGELLAPWYGMAPGLAIEMADQRAPNARIVVATRQSLHKKRLDQVLDFGAFDHLIVDECHHLYAGGTYNHIIDRLTQVNPNVKVIGFSATPKRTDGRALQVVFDSICFEWSILRGISSGWLVPPTRIVVGTGVNTSGVNTVAGDYNEKQLLTVLEASNWRELVVKAYVDHIKPTGRQTLAYLPKVKMSQEFVAELCALGIKAAHIDGETPREERARILREYGAGEINIVSNYGVILEGLDVPETGAILYARPTRSQTLLTQIIGRGLRLFPGKKDCLVVDLTVMDTKVLQAGNLDGRMRECKHCHVKFYDGFKQCPACGKDVYDPTQKPLFPGGGKQPVIIGDRIISSDAMRASLGSLFDNLQASWTKNAQGVYAASMGFSSTNLIITPPDYIKQHEYELIKLETIDGKVIRTVLRSNADLASLMLEADSMVIKSVPKYMRDSIKKDAPWRVGKPSDKQVDLLRKLGVAVSPEMSKGEVSDLITSLLADKRSGRV